MDSFFGLACAALMCQLALVLWRGLVVVDPELLMLPNGTVLYIEDYARVAGRAMRDVSRAAGDLRVFDVWRLAYHDFGWLWPLALLTGLAHLLRRKSAVYLLDFSLFKPPEEWKVSQAKLMALLRSIGEARGSYDASDLAFMEKVLGNSGTGDKTAWPPGIVRCADPAARQHQSMQAAREEAETIICGALEGLFARTGIQPKEVDFLIINCSLFSPTPSLCALASNRFRFRSNCRTFNLSGQVQSSGGGRKRPPGGARDAGGAPRRHAARQTLFWFPGSLVCGPRTYLLLGESILVPEKPARGYDAPLGTRSTCSHTELDGREGRRPRSAHSRMPHRCPLHKVVRPHPCLLPRAALPHSCLTAPHPYLTPGLLCLAAVD